MKRSVQVEIAGVKLAIRSDAGPEYVQHLADYVDGHLRELGGSSRSSYNLGKVALLVAVQIADELFRERDLHDRYREQVEGKLERLREAIEDHESVVGAL